MKKIINYLSLIIFIYNLCLLDSFAKETTQKPQYWPSHISWSSPSGSKWIIAVGLTSVIQKYTGVSSAALGPTGGGIADLRNLSAKKAEIAWAGNPSVSEAWSGVGVFKTEGSQKWVRAISGGYLAYWYIVASRKSGIKKFEDLKGHRWSGDVMVGSDVTDQAREGLLKIHGMTKSDYKGIPITKFSECVAMMKEGRADAATFFGGIPSPQALELTTSMDITWVSLSPEAASKVSTMIPGHSPAVIPAGTYKGQDQDVMLVSHMTLPIVHVDIHEDVLYEIMKAIFDHPDEAEAIHPSIKDFARKPASTEVTVPYHKGAIKYYKEKKLWTPQLDTLQMKLLAK